MYKYQIIDWFVYNEATVKILYEGILKRKLNDPVLFEDEFCEQFNKLLKEEVFGYITRELGCSLDEVYEIVDNEMFLEYVNKL